MKSNKLQMKSNKTQRYYNRSTGTTLDIFKTLVRLKVVESIVNPLEWVKWYGEILRFGRKYE